jgi:hypothetical protein
MFGDLCIRETVPSMAHALERAPIDKTRKSLRVNAGRDSLARGGAKRPDRWRA